MRAQVLIADYNCHCVRVFRVDGTFVRKWGTKGSDPGQLLHPDGLAVRDNQVVVTSHGCTRFQIFELDGTFVYAGKTKNTETNLSTHMSVAVLRQGQLLLSHYKGAGLNLFQ